MGHKPATFEYPMSGQYSQGPHLPPDWIQNRPPEVKHYYSPTRRSRSRAHPPRRRRSRRRQANYRPLIILVPTLVVGVLLVRLLISFLPDFCKAEVPKQETLQKVAVPSPTQVQPPVIPPVVALSRAIIVKESSADFQSLNPHSGALGLAQVMPANLSAWSQDVLGYRLTSEQFLNDPDIQMKIIKHKLSEYWQEALADSKGNEDVAVLRVASYWYSGDPNLYTSTEPQFYQGKNGKLHHYPSVAKYSNSVLQKYRKYKKGD